MTSPAAVAASLMAVALVAVSGHEDGLSVEHSTPLAVTVTPVNARFCSPTPDDAPIFTMLIDLAVRFTNTSVRPVIVAREIPGVVRGRVADDVAAGEEGRIKFRFGGTEGYSGADTPTFGARPDAGRFAVLAPGQTSEVVTQLGLFVRTAAAPPMERSLTVGSQYAVQVDVPTWPYPWMSKADIQRLRESWGPVGDLITDHVESGFFLVSVQADAKPKVCEPTSD
jgi:hypothetical protein